MTIQEATEQLIQAIREDALAKLVVHFEQMRPGSTGPIAKYGRKRDPAVIDDLTEQLLSYVRNHPGLRMENIAKWLEIETKDLMLPMKRLLAKGLVRTKGQRRATTYFPR